MFMPPQAAAMIHPGMPPVHNAAILTAIPVRLREFVHSEAEILLKKSSPFIFLRFISSTTLIVVNATSIPSS